MTIGDVYKFFSRGGKDSPNYNGYTLSNFQKDWKDLSDTDKSDLRSGIENGTLTY